MCQQTNTDTTDNPMLKSISITLPFKHCKLTLHTDNSFTNNTGYSKIIKKEKKYELSKPMEQV